MLHELRAMLSLAIPVIVAELGWITMGIVDTIVVRALGPAAIGAVGTGSTIFMAVVVLGVGTLFALDTFVSQNYGAGRLDECHRWLFAGVQLTAIAAVVLAAILLAIARLLPLAGLNVDVLKLLDPYLTQLVWSIPPVLAYTVFRRYLQAMNVVRPVMVTLVSANVINAAANWAFVYGHFGLPALGVTGSAYATAIARLYMSVVLLLVIVWKERREPSGLHDVPFTIDFGRIMRLVYLGFPAAIQLTLEVGVFATSCALAARLTPIALAANQIVLNVASFFFMIPLGLSSAAAVRVGQAVGRVDPRGVRAAGWTALGLAFAYALVMSALFIGVPRLFLSIFTDDEMLLRTTTSVLFIYAICQPFDGMQNVATGALRGVGETRLPMLFNLAGHWPIGLPLAYFLCFNRSWGVYGLWSGLSVSLFLVAVALVIVWHRRTAQLVAIPTF